MFGIMPKVCKRILYNITRIEFYFKINTKLCFLFRVQC